MMHIDTMLLPPFTTSRRHQRFAIVLSGMSAEAADRLTTRGERIAEQTGAACVLVFKDHVTVGSPELPDGGHMDMTPTLGQIVHYRGKEGRLAMRAAIVTGTVDSITPDGIASGDVPDLDDAQHVHLWVFTPGSSSGFPEFNVSPARTEDGDIAPGSWGWPPRV